MRLSVLQFSPFQSPSLLLLVNVYNFKRYLSVFLPLHYLRLYWRFRYVSSSFVVFRHKLLYYKNSVTTTHQYILILCPSSLAFSRSISLSLSFSHIAESLAHRQIHFTHFHSITHMHHMYKHVFPLSFSLLFMKNVCFWLIASRSSGCILFGLHGSLFRMANIEIVFSFVATNV